MANSEEMLLYNGALLNSIRKNKTPEEKIKKIKKYLDKGADVNAIDANNKYNTPLHVAVLKEESEIIEFLLKKGAHVTNINSDGQTALDIALSSKTPKSKYIIEILEKKYETNSTDMISISHSSQTLTQSNVTLPIDGSSVETSKPINQMHNQQHYKTKPKITKATETYNYQKRSGTAGLSGQLYETKLLSLILFRALYIYNVEHFILGTNVEGMGAFDDIVFRYCSNKNKTPRIVFIQAKHRDNPSKDKLTVEEILKLNGDFSLHKYLESYIKICQKFIPNNEDEMFSGEFKSIECDFIIYTSAMENFSKKKFITQDDGEHLIGTHSGGKIFQFAYDNHDVELLVQTVAKSRAVLLAKRLLKFILKDSHSNMMTDDLIKTYHVFLAQNVLEIEVSEVKPELEFNFAKFKESFFTSNDKLISAIRVTIAKEIAIIKNHNLSNDKHDEVESIIKSLSFKVPVSFGNVNFCVIGSEKKRQRRLDYICGKFVKLFENAEVLENIVVKVDDSMVGQNKILQSSDIENYRLGGMVGNLLIFDDVSKMLKFNTDKNSLSKDNLELCERLKEEVFIEKDLNKCRLDINVHRFPRLSLVHEEYDKKLIKDFLDKLKFYTNQATEEKVERILKQEIDKYFIQSNTKQNKALFKLKSDAIFLKVHDMVQKWWKCPNKAPYLTKSCEYFIQSEQDILNSPLLSILNFNYTNVLKNILSEFEFKETAIDTLKLDLFFRDLKRILIIVAEEIVLSSMKLIQYFRKVNEENYTFIDLNYIYDESYFVDLKLELTGSKINVLIIVYENGKTRNIFSELFFFINSFKGRIIIIAKSDLTYQINKILSENIIKKIDNKTSLIDIEAKGLPKLLNRNILFQGQVVQLGNILKIDSLHIINSNVLYKIINNEKIVIGKSFNTPSYDEILDYYIDESLCRYIKLDTDVKSNDQLQVINYNKLDVNFIPDERDIIIISNKHEEFDKFCNVYRHCNNVHWFINDNNNLIWKKSRGELLNILKHICRGSNKDYTFQPVTLKDLRDRVVIISGEPGLGKSCLLTHIAINTKLTYPSLWISKINLLEHVKVLNNLKTNKVNIDYDEAIRFLFQVIGFEAFNENEVNKPDIKKIARQISSMDVEIYFNNNDLKLSGLHLLEIELFINCFNNGNIAILFDGFDEICPDFSNEFMQLLRQLKRSKICNIWVSSRLYNVLHELENSLETFSFTIQPISDYDRLVFLEKIWTIKLGKKQLHQEPFKSWSMRHIICGFLNVLKAVLCDHNNKFLGIPLHLFMISENFQDSFYDFPLHPEGIQSFIKKQGSMDKVNLSQLYERFVDVKFFKIRFGEKKPFLCIDDPDIRKMVGKERAQFLLMHKKIAAHLIVDKKYGMKYFDEQEISVFLESVTLGEEKTGIIEEIIQKEPKFIHFTFAEYFATEFLFEKLEFSHSEPFWWSFLLISIFQSDEGGIRRFFNARLGNNPQTISDLVANANENLNGIFQDFFLQPHRCSSTLIIALNEYLENNTLFLLNIFKSVLNHKSQLFGTFMNIITMKLNKSCVVCTAVKRSAVKTMKFIIGLIKDFNGSKLIDIFYCFDLPEFNPMLLAFGGLKDLVPNLEILPILISALSSSDIVKVFSIEYDNYNTHMKLKKLVHIIIWAVGHRVFKFLDDTLKRLTCQELIELLSLRDSEGKLAFHIAGKSSTCYTVFNYFYSILDKDDFKKFCTTVDNDGLTPIQYIKYREDDHDDLKALLNKIYEGDTNPKLTVEYFIDNKFRP